MDNITGLHVKYYDYLGLERFGRIIFTEPYPYDTSILYVYIEDEETEFNIHKDVLNGNEIEYAEIRLSSEVYIDEKQ